MGVGNPEAFTAQEKVEGVGEGCDAVTISQDGVIVDTGEDGRVGEKGDEAESGGSHGGAQVTDGFRMSGFTVFCGLFCFVFHGKKLENGGRRYDKAFAFLATIP